MFPEKSLLKWAGLDPRRVDMRRFLRDPDGYALLALLCNARAKQEDPKWYRWKVVLIHRALIGRSRRTWWKDKHTHTSGGTTAHSVIFIETAFGQVAFHLLGKDAKSWRFWLAPRARGRRWSRVPMQERARDIAYDFVRTYYWKD